MFGKIFANSWYVGSFASGGMIMPAIIVGSLLGGVFGLTLASFGFIEPSNTGGYVVVGAVSVLAALTNAPIGCAIFALVIFGVPFAVPALIGTMVAWQVSKFETIYGGGAGNGEKSAQERK
jgi:CIC family chloride channel protein